MSFFFSDPSKPAASRGRPKKDKPVTIKVAKKRGRPKGSKNKNRPPQFIEEEDEVNFAAQERLEEAIERVQERSAEGAQKNEVQTAGDDHRVLEGPAEVVQRTEDTDSQAMHHASGDDSFDRMCY